MASPDSSGNGMPHRLAAESAPSAVHILPLRGELNIVTSPAVRGELDALIAGGTIRIVVDCAALEYIDSTGLGTLVSALKQTDNRSGGLALARPNEWLSRMLRVTGLSRLFPIFADVEAARASLEYF